MQGMIAFPLFLFHLVVLSHHASTEAAPFLRRSPLLQRKEGVTSSAAEKDVAEAFSTTLRPNDTKSSSSFLLLNLIPSPYLKGLTGALLLGRVVSSEAVRRAVYFWFQAGPVIAHYKFTQWWLGSNNNNKSSLEKRNRVYESLHNRYAQPAYEIMIRQKGLYVKIGQVLSARPDFLPRQYLELFAHVQDAIPQWPVQHVRQIISETLLAKDYEDVFASIDPVALGSASIGQVHAAVLTKKWGNRAVAVKVSTSSSSVE